MQYFAKEEEEKKRNGEEHASQAWEFLCECLITTKVFYCRVLLRGEVIHK